MADNDNKENVTIDIFTATVPQLKDFLRDKGVQISGNKPELIKRVQGVLNLGIESLKSVSGRDEADRKVRETNKLLTPLGENLPRPDELSCDWSENVEIFPPFTKNELYNYLVLNKERTCDGASNNAGRQLKAKVFYEDKHVHSVQCNLINEDLSHCYVRCRVIPSLPGQTRKEDYRVWVCLSTVTGHVHSASCDCAAGEGESCNHIAGLLYALEDITHVRKEGLNASTSKGNKWKQPRKRILTAKKSQDLVFKKHKFSDIDKKTSATMKDLFPEEKVKSSGIKNVDTNAFAAKLRVVNPHAGWLYTTCIDNECEKDDIKQIIDVDFMLRDSVDLNSAEVKSMFADKFKNISLTEQETAAIELETRGQLKNVRWEKVRYQLFTSSNFGLVVNRQETTKPDAAVKTILGYEKFSNRATKWGRTHEPAARRKYVHIMKGKADISVSECGLIVNRDYPYLGTSPDGLITCDGELGVLEVKCPYKKRKNTPLQACEDPKFFCHIVNGNVTLKRNHKYFYQIQGQMALTRRTYCDFFVWTLAGYSVERIYFDSAIWADLLGKLRSFYLHFILPELFTEQAKRGKCLGI